jgi:hypothetical protein
MTYDTTAPIPGWPPTQPVPPTPAKRRRPPVWALATGGVALAGLAAGLLIWQPWVSPPGAPTAVQAVSKTATSVDVQWTAGKGGSAPDHFVVFRDGKEAATVPASQTTFTDTGLAPGARHQYTVTATGGGKQSGQSGPAAVTTITPAPVGLALSRSGYTSVGLRWTPSPDAPVPDSYTISQDGTPVATVPGASDTYTISKLATGRQYAVTVTASWGHATSSPATLNAPTLAPPLSGSVPLVYKITSTPGSGAFGAVGQHWTDTWQFSARCTDASCTLTDSAEYAPPGLRPVPFTVTLTPSGNGFSGTATAQATECGTVAVHNAITLHIAPGSGGLSHGKWLTWTGTMQLSSPYTTASSTTFCPAQSWNFNLTGTSA